MDRQEDSFSPALAFWLTLALVMVLAFTAVIIIGPLIASFSLLMRGWNGASLKSKIVAIVPPIGWLVVMFCGALGGGPISPLENPWMWLILLSSIGSLVMTASSYLRNKEEERNKEVDSSFFDW